jgi:NADPH:quinone reductase-like Zn-dependent oxidoreductase
LIFELSLMRRYELETPAGIEALRVVERPQPQPGYQQVLIKVRATSLNYRDLVVVRGGYGIQFAKMHGARVIITSGSNAKLERAKALGTDEVINYNETPDWDTRVFELTDHIGVDHVVEVGGAGTLPRSLRAVCLGGRISLIGVVAGGASEVNPMPVLMKSVTMQGIYVGSREMFEAMNQAIALHQLHPVIDQVFPFNSAPEAYRCLEQAGHFSKIVIAV